MTALLALPMTAVRISRNRQLGPRFRNKELWPSGALKTAPCRRGLLNNIDERMGCRIIAALVVQRDRREFGRKYRRTDFQPLARRRRFRKRADPETGRCLHGQAVADCCHEFGDYR